MLLLFAKLNTFVAIVLSIWPLPQPPMPACSQDTTVALIQ